MKFETDGEKKKKKMRPTAPEGNYRSWIASIVEVPSRENNTRSEEGKKTEPGVPYKHEKIKHHTTTQNVPITHRTSLQKSVQSKTLN